MKKLIISLTIAMILCIAFALGVSAKTVYLEEIPAELKFANDTVTHFIVIEDEKYFNLNGTQIRTLNGDAIAADLADAGIDASQIGTKYLTRFNFPAKIGDVNVTDVYFETIKQNKTYYHSKVGYVQLEPSVIPTGNMNDTTAQLRCFDFGEGNITTKIPGYLCSGASKLKMVKNFPQNVTVIEGNAFCYCKNVVFDDLNIEKVTQIGSRAFQDCHYAFSGEIYFRDVTTIDAYAFSNAVAKVTKMTFGPNLKSLGYQSLCALLNEFGNYGAPAEIQIETVEFQGKLSNVTIHSGAFYFVEQTPRSPYSKLKTVILSDIDDEKSMTADSVIADFSKDGADIAFGNTTYTLSTVHDYTNAKIAYSSFLENGGYSCVRCGAISPSAELKPIFVCEGYSVPTTGEFSITVRFRVNKDALENYENTAGCQIEYGLVATAKSQNAPLNEDGTVADPTVVQAPLTRDFSIFQVKLANIGEDKKDTQIVLCGYAIERKDDEIVSIVYLEETQKTAETLNGVSYTAIASKAS